MGDGRGGTLRALRCGAALLACLLAAGPVAAQESVHNGSIAGRVSDAQGGMVPGAAVTARQTQTTVETTTSTDAGGRFRLPYLRVGEYDLRVVVPGFGVWTQALTLTAGAAFEIPVTLQADGVTTDIVESAVRRFRPIVLTAAAAVLAMVPLSRSVFWGPMAVAIMGGLIVATVLTLLALPAMYAAWFRVRSGKSGDAA